MWKVTELQIELLLPILVWTARNFVRARTMVRLDFIRQHTVMDRGGKLGDEKVHRIF